MDKIEALLIIVFTAIIEILLLYYGPIIKQNPLLKIIFAIIVGADIITLLDLLLLL